MRTSTRNASGPVKEITVKMKVVELLETAVEFLTVDEVARLLNVSKSLVYRLAATGELTASRVSGAIRIDPNHVIAWLKQQTPPCVARSEPQRASPAHPLERAG